MTVEIDTDGNKYYRNSLRQFHRDNDLPAIEYVNGNKVWYKNGLCHRIGGPASECIDGYKVWYVNGKPHRLDGPAVDYPNKYAAWHINGIELTEEEFNHWSKDWNEEKEIMFGLTYS